MIAEEQLYFCLGLTSSSIDSNRCKQSFLQSACGSFPKAVYNQSPNEFFRITGLRNTQHFSGKWTALVGHRVLVGSGSNRVQGAGFDAIDFLSVPPAQGQKCCGDRGHAAPRGCAQSSLAPFSSLQPSSPVSSFGP